MYAVSVIDASNIILDHINYVWMNVAWQKEQVQFVESSATLYAYPWKESLTKIFYFRFYFLLNLGLLMTICKYIKINLQYVVSNSRLINFVQNSGGKTGRLNSIKMKYLSGYLHHIFNFIKHFSSFYLSYQAPSTWAHLPEQKPSSLTAKNTN